MMLFKKKASKGPQGDLVGTHEKLPSDFLTWSEKKQDKFLRDLLRSVSPGPVAKNDEK
jgi:hypothetical protein